MTASRRHRDRGASLVEFALILPVFALFIFATIDFGHLYSQDITVKNGAREGARSAAVGAAPADIQDAVLRSAANLEAADVQLAVRVQEANHNAVLGDPGDEIVVCVKFPMRSLSGFMAPLLNGQLTSTSTMRLEQPAAVGASGYQTGGWTGTCAA